MRWMWIDRITEIVPERRLVAIKNVTLAEEHLHDHFAASETQPALPIYPASLITEGMAQTAGILVGHARGFREKVVLAKITAAQFDREVLPGQTIRFEAELDRIDDAGAATTGTVSCTWSERGDFEPIGAIELLFSHADRNQSGLDLPKHNFVFGDNLSVLLDSAGLRG